MGVLYFLRASELLLTVLSFAELHKWTWDMGPVSSVWPNSARSGTEDWGRTRDSIATFLALSAEHTSLAENILHVVSLAIGIGRESRFLSA